ncbi:MAG: tetratricopeptide repeat protein [Pseudomonadota bacterium]|nr:tetratricopeptide repeat protein [Pseudomonadota bacterium]
MVNPEGEIPEDRQVGRKPEPLPDRANPTEIAMGVMSRENGLRNPARRLLAQQAALVSGQRKLIGTEFRQRRLQIIAVRIGIAFKATLIAAFGLFVILLAVILFAAIRSEKVVVEPFKVPETLTEAGASGDVVADGIVDELTRLQAATRTDAPLRPINSAWSRQVEVEFPQTGASIGEIRRFLMARLGNDTRVSGSVTREDGTLRLTVRGDGIPAKSFSGPLKELPGLYERAAEYLYGSAEPALYLLYLNQTGRGAEAVDFAPGAFKAARTDEERSMVAADWAMALTTRGRYGEAKERARIAVRLDPNNWRAHTIMIDALTDDEQALAASRWLRRRMAGARNRRLRDSVIVREYLLTQNWTALIAMYLQDPGDAVQQETAAVSRGPSLPEAEAYRHDHQAARRHLLTADPTDDIVRPTRYFTAGLRELDLGRADLAVAPLERFHRKLMGNPELRHVFRGHQCHLAIAYARLGRTADALRVLDAEPESSRCRAFRGDVFALAGNWPAAADAYRSAIRRSPSLPIPYERAGAALLARDEPERAARLFRASIERGPHWADPRFGLAEALMQLGRFEEAEREYREAARYAPRWGALHMGWGEALWRLGRRAEAREKFRSAAGMDLSAANRARLKQLAAMG